ncbi:MAG TPA: hypothetical protein VJN18_11615 [Polyangiaceae bacterium]|nr:hypothetical protein [Polyangiaceae bacterium]
MPTEPRFLRSADFGAFEPELKRTFKEGFGFTWDGGSESPEEAERRARFSKIVGAARPQPDAPPSAGLELLRQCYALHRKILTYLNPEDDLRDQLSSLAAAVSKVGKKVTRLPTPTQKNSQHGSPSVLELRHAWVVLEDGLGAAIWGSSGGSVADELARLREVASQANAQLANIGALLKNLSVGGQNEVVASERAKEVRAIAASVQRLSQELQAFCIKCVPAADDQPEVRAYLERVAQAVPAQCWYESNDGVLTLRTEVPWAALTIHRDLAERRGAILESLCTWDPEFFPLLPGALRRDHGTPAATGGKGKKNWVLNGITAALVLLELVEAAPVHPKTGGKDLFEATTKRVERWIDGLTKSGGFFVEATTPPDAQDRRRHGHDRPLQARYPLMPKPEDT